MRIFLIVPLASCVLASSAAAQVLTPPPRSAPPARRAADANRPEHELLLDLSLLGGYDDNLSPTGEGVTSDPLTPARSGLTGTTTGELRYRYRSQARSLEATGRAHMNSFRNLGVQPLYGGDLNVRATTELGSRFGLSASAGTQYQPTFMFMPQSAPALAPEAPAVPPIDPTSGIAEQRSRTADVYTRLGYNWSTRQNTSIGYGYSRNVVTTDAQVNTKNQTASLAHSWDMTRSAGLTFDYVYTTNESEATNLAGVVVRPVDSHSAQAGFRIQKRLSATRSITFTAGAGAMQVQADPSAEAIASDYISPSYTGGARMDLGRTWSLSADLQRSVSVLPGLTQQSFLTDTVSVWVGGDIGRRTVVALNAQYTDGRPHEGQFGSFEGLSSTAQLTYEYSRCCALLASYSYYEHRLRDLSAVPTGFPSRFERNAVRIGTTIRLPLVGSLPTGRPTTTTGRN